MTSIYEQGCIALATAFMKKIHDDLDEDYKLGDMNDEYFIWSADTDYASFADGSCCYVWDCPRMYLALKNNIPYKTMCEHSDWHDDFKTPDGWINLENYARRRKWSTLPPEDFQRMLQREYYENRAKNLTDASIAKDKEYMSQAMETFKKDLADMRL